MEIIIFVLRGGEGGDFHPVARNINLTTIFCIDLIVAVKLDLVVKVKSTPTRNKNSISS